MSRSDCVSHVSPASSVNAHTTTDANAKVVKHIIDTVMASNCDRRKQHESEWIRRYSVLIVIYNTVVDRTETHPAQVEVVYNHALERNSKVSPTGCF